MSEEKSKLFEGNGDFQFSKGLDDNVTNTSLSNFNTIFNRSTNQPVSRILQAPEEKEEKQIINEFIKKNEGIIKNLGGSMVSNVSTAEIASVVTSNSNFVKSLSTTTDPLSSTQTTSANVDGVILSESNTSNDILSKVKTDFSTVDETETILYYWSWMNKKIDIPVALNGFDKIKISRITTNEHMAACVANDGALYTWGKWTVLNEVDNIWVHPLGFGKYTGNSTDIQYNPLKVPLPEPVKDASLGLFHICCLTLSGLVYSVYFFFFFFFIFSIIYFYIFIFFNFFLGFK